MSEKSGLTSRRILALCGAFALTGCVQDIASSATGVLSNAATGAVSGAVIATRSQEDRAALVGSAISGQSVSEQQAAAVAEAQAQAAAVVQAQAKELQTQLAGSGASVSVQGNKIRINLPQDMSFAPNSAYLKTSAHGPLAAIAFNLQQHPNSIAQVLGSTDNSKPEAESLKLSEDRARAVAGRLEQNGIPKLRLQIVGLGSSSPIAANDTVAGRQRNNRVEIVIVPVN